MVGLLGSEMSKKEILICDGCGKELQKAWLPTSQYFLVFGKEVVVNVEQLQGYKLKDGGHVCDSCGKVLRRLIRAGYEIDFLESESGLEHE